MPHVGSHPGLGIALTFIPLGFIADGVWSGLIVTAVFLPFFALGSYERAELSDLLEKK